MQAMSKHPSVVKCDAKGCGSPATVTDRMGARFCTGHAYLASREPKS